MARMRATKKMPRGVLNRYRTRMLTADTFEEPSPKWSRFYAQHGWATPVPDEPEPAPASPRRSRNPDPKPPAPQALEGMTVPELRDLAEEKGLDLPGGYLRKDDLIDKIAQAGEGEGLA